MPKDIPTPPHTKILEGVLVGRGDLRKAARVRLLEREARRRASLLVREAEGEAQVMRLQAYRLGYEQGVVEGLGHVLEYLADWKSLFLRQRSLLEEHIKSCLKAAVDNPEVIIMLIEEWLLYEHKPDGSIHILLPETSRVLHDRVLAILDEHGAGMVQIDYHFDPRLIMRCGDQVAEFAPEQVVELTSRQLSQALNKMPEDCYRVSQEALQRLISKIQKNDAGAPGV